MQPLKERRPKRNLCECLSFRSSLCLRFRCGLLLLLLGISRVGVSAPGSHVPWGGAAFPDLRPYTSRDCLRHAQSACASSTYDALSSTRSVTMHRVSSLATRSAPQVGRMTRQRVSVRLLLEACSRLTNNTLKHARGFATGKDIRFGAEARSLIMRGVDKIADAVQVTLGPKVA